MIGLTMVEPEALDEARTRWWNLSKQGWLTSRIVVMSSSPTQGESRRTIEASPLERVGSEAVPAIPLRLSRRPVTDGELNLNRSRDDDQVVEIETELEERRSSRVPGGTARGGS